MRHWLLPCCVLLGLWSAALWNAACVERSVQHWNAQLQAVSAAAQEERWEDASDALAQTCADWSQRQIWLRIVSVHDTLDETQALLSAARTHLYAQEQNELRDDLAALAAQLTLLHERERLSLENIL